MYQQFKSEPKLMAIIMVLGLTSAACAAPKQGNDIVDTAVKASSFKTLVTAVDAAHASLAN